MSKALLFATFLSLSLFPGLARADAGGVPNENANAVLGGPGSEGQGRKTTCNPPGSAFRQTAKEPGPNNEYTLGLTPGQSVSQLCVPD
jgi:hypothetical protein